MNPLVEIFLDKICWKLKIGKPYRVSFPRFDWWRPTPSNVDLSKWLEDNTNKDEWTTKVDGLWRRYYFKNSDKATLFKIIWN